MEIQMKVLIILLITLWFILFKPSNSEEEVPKPDFDFSWLDEKDTYKAGEVAKVKVKASTGLVNADGNKFRPSLSVNGKVGNSSYISDVFEDLRGDNPDNWNITFTVIASGSFNLVINENNYQVFDSSLHFQVDPGEIYPSVSIASWMGYTNEFEAGSKGVVGIIPRDAFGNNVTSTSGDPSWSNFTLTALHSNGSVSSYLNVTRVGWNEFGFIDVEFLVVEAGHFFLLVAGGGGHELRGNPLQFKVNPGPLEVSNCEAKSKYEPNSWQLFSEMELFIHQRDQYGNLVLGMYEFDAEVIEKETNLSIPLPDLRFKEVAPGIQSLSFVNFEPGNFLLKVSDSKHNHTISNMPFAFTVFAGYCNGTTSIVNGTGLNNSVAGEISEFTVYLGDSYQYPSLVKPETLGVQIIRQFDSYIVLPKISPIQIITDNGTEIAPSPSVDPSNHTVDNSKVLASDFDVIYTPEKSGSYEIRIFCGNIPLDGGRSFTKEVTQGMVNLSLSGVVKFDPKVPKQINNEVTINLMDSFYNPVSSQQSKLRLEVTSLKNNTSYFSTQMFIDNNDGSYKGFYSAEEIGTYVIFAWFDGKKFSQPSFEVNVYSSEYFPRAFDDIISVWEDESIAFDALSNDYFAGENASIIELSEPSHGSLLQNERIFRYTPIKDYYGNDSFVYTISDVNSNLASASVNISVLAIPPQFISYPSQLEATEDEISPRYGGFSGFELRFSDMFENISVNVSAQSGTVYLSPMVMQFWPIKTRLSIYKAEPKSLILEGTVEVVNSALKSIQYFGDENFYGIDTLRLASKSANGVNSLDIPIYVDPINDPPFIRVPEFIILKSNEDESLIFNPDKDKFEFLVGDPDLHGFPGNESLFMVIFSIEVDTGFLSTNLRSELINTTELRTMNTYQWKPLQTYVTISHHFSVKANGIRFRGTVKDCNDVMKELFYSGGDHGTLLRVTINDMGNYGCYPNCNDMGSVPLHAEAVINLIRRKPMTLFVSRVLGSAIVVESIIVLSLGAVLLFFTCRCALVLVHQKRENNNAVSQPNSSLKGT